MRVQQELITPKKAAEYLKHNTLNRPISEKTVQKYSNEMKNGLWPENGETLKFSGDGTLLDGQHRLLALLRSGVTIPMIVVTGLPKETFANLDNGKKRSLSDILAIAGYDYYTDIAAALRIYYHYKIKNKFTPNSTLDFANNSVYLKFLSENSSLVESVKLIAKRKHEVNIVGVGMLAALHCIFKEKDVNQADKFIESFITGANLSKDSVIRKLREKFINYKFNKIRLAADMKIMLLVKAWNYYRLGDNPKSLNANENSVMPKII